MDTTRRRFLWATLLGIFSLYGRRNFAAPDFTDDRALAPFVLANRVPNPGNFRAVFTDAAEREKFFLFLKNVYNIYPEKEFLDLIGELSATHRTDEEIYNAILSRIVHIKPLLSEVRYALPALAKQKKEIAEQTMQLLHGRGTIAGYLEIGTPGRYVNAIRSRVAISGDVAVLNVSAPSFAPLDIAERGQLTKNARFIALKEYDSISDADAPTNAYGVITNYIGFHHCPLGKLDAFVTSIHRVLKPGGTFILRDHDVADPKANRIVALAHDVFNAGLGAAWDFNHREVRNFRPLTHWIDYLAARGFNFGGKMLYQSGDPTRNALVEFTKS